MNRLTYKLDEPIKTKYLNYEYKRIPDYDIDQDNYGRISDDMIFNKLGKLEDIEEELGIDLVTLFKIIKQKYVYTNRFNKRIEQFVLTKIDGIEKDYLGRNYLRLDFQEVEYDDNGNEIDSIIHWIPDTRDYGKTFALTKEELENE